MPDENPSGLGIFEFPLSLSRYYRDKETGMAYAMFRDCYDPAMGRFCQSDPIGLRGGLNTFAYASARPVDHVDPLGLQASGMSLGQECFALCMGVVVTECIKNPGYGYAMCAACAWLRSPPLVAACAGACVRNPVPVCVAIGTVGCTAACAAADLCRQLYF